MSTYTQPVLLAFSLLITGAPLRTIISATCVIGICAPVGVGTITRFNLLILSLNSLLYLTFIGYRSRPSTV